METNFAKVLRNIAKCKRLTLRAVSEDVGITESSLNNRLSRDTSFARVVQMANAMGEDVVIGGIKIEVCKK